MNSLYNAEIKEKYLETLAEKSVAPIKNALYKSNDIEEVLEKDLYDFAPEEVKQVLSHANSKSVAGVRNILSYLSGYIAWAIGQGYRNSTISPISSIDTSTAALMEFIDKSRKLFYSNDEIDQIVDKLMNFQDKAVVHLAFYEGLTMEEIMDLDYYHVDWQNGILKIRPNKDKTVFKISDKSLRLLESAYHESEYVAVNTEARRELAKSDFIIRNTVSPRTKNVTKISKSVIFSRITNIREYFGYEDFTYKAISKSGMIHDAFKLYQERGKLDSDGLSEVATKFGVSKITVKGYEYHNVSILKKFISRENILDLYEVDIEA